MRHTKIEYEWDWTTGRWTATVRSGTRVVATGVGETRDEADRELRSEMRALIRLSAAIANAGRVC